MGEWDGDGGGDDGGGSGGRRGEEGEGGRGVGQAGEAVSGRGQGFFDGEWGIVGWGVIVGGGS